MENWFTVENIDNDTFAISEYQHWEETHCYLVCGTQKAVLIDTGLGIENIRKVTDSLTALPIIHTPGHSPGHCCFYEPERKYLYTGDLIYSGCLDAFYPTTDPETFWESVRKIQPLEKKRVLPGHHSLNIPITIIDSIEKAFQKLAQEGKLRQGNGVFDFDGFQIHI